jgi:hypothetical protein
VTVGAIVRIGVSVSAMAHVVGITVAMSPMAIVGIVLDFQQTYWHSRIPPAIMAIDNVVLNELAVNDDATWNLAGRFLGTASFL